VSSREKALCGPCGSTPSGYWGRNFWWCVRSEVRWKRIKQKRAQDRCVNEDGSALSDRFDGQVQRPAFREGLLNRVSFLDVPVRITSPPSPNLENVCHRSASTSVWTSCLISRTSARNSATRCVVVCDRPKRVFVSVAPAAVLLSPLGSRDGLTYHMASPRTHSLCNLTVLVLEGHPGRPVLRPGA